MWEEVAAITSRYGLNLKPQGIWQKDEVFQKLLEEFAIRQASNHVRRRLDGKPVDWETVIVWLHDLKEGEDKSLFKQAVQKVIAKKGGEKDFDKRIDLLLTRILGHYRRFLGYKHNFHFNLAVPGEVVETNGILVSGNSVRWVFDGEFAWPLGYEMTCRSLDAQPQVQQNLLGGQPLADREAMLEFRELMRTTPRLVEVLRICRKEKKLAALYALRKDQTTNSAYLLKLLKLPPEPPAGGR
jgi:hypothetical protein